MIIHMLSYNTVHNRGVIHIPILCKIPTAKHMFKTTKHLTIQSTNKQTYCHIVLKHHMWPSGEYLFALSCFLSR